MNYRLIAFAALLLGAISVVSCVDPDQTQEVILEKDKQAIEKYISENPFAAVRSTKRKWRDFICSGRLPMNLVQAW
jgi:hypothetical protein